MNKIVRNEKPDIIHSHINSYSFIPLFLGFINKVKVRIAHAHGSGTDKTILNRIFSGVIGIFATDYFACSKSAGNYVFNNKSKYTIINNTLDVNLYKRNKEIKKN